MRKITKIEANRPDLFANPKLRVAAYCRVSTDSNEQLESLKAQTTCYEKHIKANPEWEYLGVYFIAETKGSLDSMELRNIEKAKIDCAKSLFNNISTTNLRYDRVTDYQSLLNIVK